MVRACLSSSANASSLLRVPIKECDGWLILSFLAFPSLIFYFFIGQLWAAACLGLALYIALPAFKTNQPLASSLTAARVARTGACLACALVLTTLGGEGRLLPATHDWFIRDAVLHDVTVQPWPFEYQVFGQDYVLRAPLGMFLAPALVGKLLGVYASYLALWAQNTLGLFLALWIFTETFKLSRGLAVLITFCVFSGWDVPGALITSSLKAAVTHAAFSLPADVGWWAGMFQYSSTITLAYWVPNHALAGWFVVALLLLWERGRIGISALMIGAGLSFVWSPFALMGTLPFLAKAGLEAFRKNSIGLRTIGPVVLCALALLPLYAYLSSDTESLPHGFQPWTAAFWLLYVLFISAEILPFAFLNKRFGRTGEGFSHSTYIVALVVLVLLPFYRLGGGNDLVMRASIPSLAILAINTGHTVFDCFSSLRPMRIVAATLVVGLGFLTGINQTWHILTAQNAGISACDLINAWDQDPRSLPSKASYLASLPKIPQPIRPILSSIDKPDLVTIDCATAQISRQINLP
jgi:hypothetical protein